MASGTILVRREQCYPQFQVRKIVESENLQFVISARAVLCSFGTGPTLQPEPRIISTRLIMLPISGSTIGHLERPIVRKTEELFQPFQPR